MTARIAIVPASTILRNPMCSLRSWDYILDRARLHHREKVAQSKIKQGLGAMRECAKERADVLAFQAENGIQEYKA